MLKSKFDDQFSSLSTARKVLEGRLQFRQRVDLADDWPNLKVCQKSQGLYFKSFTVVNYATVLQ